jgi:hypothetical protein
MTPESAANGEIGRGEDDLGPLGCSGSGGSSSTSWRENTTSSCAPGDSLAATQLEDKAALWNPKAYVKNARTRIRIRAAPLRPPRRVRRDTAMSGRAL